MEYSIQELSRLSGVTTRTLRWYDQIGLLKPSRVADERFTACYDKQVPGCARFLRDAVAHWVK